MNGNYICKRNQHLRCGIEILCRGTEYMTLEQVNKYY